ncbi:hypothetical protein PV08_04831 [Exophiala spinifera]|uniref:Uncharacterized protein n=1 Tax=Exophiala spinifera TaxID=91928 RepID=A0A0D1YQY3_9EURO|nr:uncharacterized protein PV08_04831 [Exophiala spinifera]KIW17636.1 hypothetical protein PV08_04831 [Exophiala spinifera]
MRFAQQRPDKAIEIVREAPEARRRNRLSKPLTKKPGTSVSTTSLPEPVPKPRNASTGDRRIGGPLSSNPSDAALRQQIRSDVFGSSSDSQSKHSKTESSWSIAYMVKEAEEASVEEPRSLQQEEQPLSPVKPRKRKSLILRRLSTHRSNSFRSSTSSGRLNSLHDEATSASTPASPLDRIVDAPSIPPTRRASFTPGTATRKASRVLREEQIDEEKTLEETEDCNVIGTDFFEWQPPEPPAMMGRAGTPADLSYSHLGGLRHGSLQVVNGRASPAFSEMSKTSRSFLLAPKANRDVSSDYGDAEDEQSKVAGPDRYLPRLNTLGKKPQRRDFSRESNKQKAQQTPLRAVRSAVHPTDSTEIADQTSLMAQEYMAELPISPFSDLKTTSSHASLRKTKSEGLLQTCSSSSTPFVSPCPDHLIPKDSEIVPPSRSPSPTGSVIYKPQRMEDGEQDHNIVGLLSNEDRQHRDTDTVWSPTRQFVDQSFQPAAELEATTPRTRLQPPPAPAKSDSGYSSSSSLNSLRKDRNSEPDTDKEALQTGPSNTANTQVERQEAIPFPRSHRPWNLKSRKTAPQLTTLSDVRPAEIASSQVSALLESDAVIAKPVKTRKKLQKKRTLSQPPPKVSIGRVHSFEGQSIPSVPHGVREALRLRSEIVPELDNTYLQETSLASIDHQETEIRFPSPAPENPVEIRRSRSRSRPRSWISRSKEAKTPSQRHSGFSHHEDNTTIIHDLGTVATSLGASPYDLAHENIVSKETLNPYSISTVALRPRYIMDDRAAAELSRSKSRTVQERLGRLGGRRSSFNDRGGIPGRNIRPASFASDAPPITPEMVLNQRLASLSSVSAAPPPPPPHVRQPSYIDYEEDYSDRAWVPPPPLHSPQPLDINPDQWPLHATTRQDKLRAIGDDLRRQSWKIHNSQDYYEDYQDLGYDETLYPVISPAENQQQGLSQYNMNAPELVFSTQDRQDHGYTPYEKATYKPSSPRYYSAYTQGVPFVQKSRHYSMIQDYSYSHGGVNDFSA